MRVVRVMLAVVAMLLAGTPALKVAAQDGGRVGFEDLVGLQTAVTRTYSGETAQADSTPRDMVKPKALMMLVGIFEFDTEANAAAGYELLRGDMNATGLDGSPLQLTEIAVPLGIPSVGGVATDTSSGTPVDFTIVAALDGTSVLSVIAITSGAPPVADIVALTRSIAVTESGTTPVAFSADGGSSGGIWDRIPQLGSVERHFRGITSVVDAVAFGG
jgi:hypothetical protein